MRKTTKVVSIAPHEHWLIASDEKSHRVIFGIGERRFAFDYFTRITELPPLQGKSPCPRRPYECTLATKNST
jgi:hypothetical protein